MHNYKELKDEITEKVTNHSSKLIDNLENKFRQINENIEKKQEERMEMMFNRLERTIDVINRQNNPRTENRNTENNNIQNNRQQYQNNQAYTVEELIQSRQKKEKQQSKNLLYHSINN